MANNNRDFNQHVLLPRSTFKGSVFDRQYTTLLREDPFELELVQDILSRIQCLYQLDREHYNYKGLDDRTKQPIRYRGREDHTIPHLPGWKAVVVGERSGPKYIKPSRNPLGFYSLRQTVYVMSATKYGEETLIPQVYGELVRESGKEAGRSITTCALPTRAILRDAFHVVYEAGKTEIDPLFEGLKEAFANS